MTKKLVPPTASNETEVMEIRPNWWRSGLSSVIRRRRLTRLRQRLQAIRMDAIVVSTIAVAAALVTLQNPRLVQFWQRNVQTSFFDLRGPLDPDLNQADAALPGIVILAMDGETMTQGTQIYPSDPKHYAYFAPIQQWPWQRTAYAIAIDRLMQAGARAVVLDVVLDAPSVYGPDDDARLRQVLKKYPGRITLAGKYMDEESRAGYETKLLLPNAQLQSAHPRLGFINFLISPDGRIHELGREFFARLQLDYGAMGATIPKIPSLAEAAVHSAQVPFVPPQGSDIFFVGPSGTFEQIPFWHVLDPQNWNGYHLKNQTFKNKIVVIGPTGGGESFQDFHNAPFSGTLRYPEKMAGVEIQANAIATLMYGKAIAPLLPNAVVEAGVVALVVILAGYLPGRVPASRSLRRFGAGVAIAVGWGVISYIVFVGGQRTLPTVVPVVAIVLSSTTCLFWGLISEKISFRKIAKRMVSSPEFQSAVSEFPSSAVQEVIQHHQQEFMGSKLDGRYQILERIGIGGFGETYKARDLKRPSQPFCVVKRLRPVNPTPRVMQLAERLFTREAEVLEQLGAHDQIPRLFAYFEEADEFYLVQEYVDGMSLADELKLMHHKLMRPLSEQTVVILLYELLQILDFVHRQGVIHRDIKPANILRRRHDRKLVLIDFGAVKQVRNVEQLETEAGETVLSVAIGTSGYSAPEQLLGRPCSASDIFSLGMTGICALTGIEPSKLNSDSHLVPHPMNWSEGLQISDALRTVIDKMVQMDVTLRYPTVQAALADLKPLVQFAVESATPREWVASQPLADDDDEVSTSVETKHWLPDEPSLELPITDPESGSDGSTASVTVEWINAVEGNLPDTDLDGQT